MIIKKYIKQGDPIIITSPAYIFSGIKKYNNLLEFSIHDFNPSINTFITNTIITNIATGTTGIGMLDNNGYIDEWKNFLGILKAGGKYEDILKKMKYDVIFLIMIEFDKEEISFINDVKSKKKK